MAKGFQTLKGFRDFYPDECAERNYIFEIWRRVARAYGFVEYEGPVLEPTDLYKRKSGNEIVGQLFCFEDKGGRDVSMRPELTPTLARMAAARQRDFKKPLRWFSIGQFFRYEKHQKGRGREFYQFNCDILGESSVLADAELIALSIDLMRAFGFSADDFKIRVSDRNAWTRFAADSGVTEEKMTTFLQIVDKLDRTPAEKANEQLAEFSLDTGKIRDFIQSGTEASPSLLEIVEDVQSRGMGEFIEIDLSIVRGLAYYTGTVFEIFDIGKGMRAIAGGGRYDQLVKLIGNVDMPACGFAMGDMVIGDFIRETEKTNESLNRAKQVHQGIDIYVVLADGKKRKESNAIVQELRSAGFRVSQALSGMKVGKQFQAAGNAAAKAVVVVGAEFPEVTVKDLKLREESRCQAGDLLSELARFQPLAS